MILKKDIFFCGKPIFAKHGKRNTYSFIFLISKCCFFQETFEHYERNTRNKGYDESPFGQQKKLF